MKTRVRVRVRVRMRIRMKMKMIENENDSNDNKSFSLPIYGPSRYYYIPTWTVCLTSFIKHSKLSKMAFDDCCVTKAK